MSSRSVNVKCKIRLLLSAKEDWNRKSLDRVYVVPNARGSELYIFQIYVCPSHCFSVWGSKGAPDQWIGHGEMTLWGNGDISKLYIKGVLRDNLDIFNLCVFRLECLPGLNPGNLSGRWDVHADSITA